MRYSAFISYSHADEAWARWLHGALETYRVPKRLIGHDAPWGPLGRRLPPVFRDRDELASSPDLAEAVRTALSEASALIVICSPRAAASRWVNEEIRSFAALHGRGRIFCLIVEGEPHGANPSHECFPPALAECGLHEPLAADLRPGQDGKPLARLKLLAGLLAIGFDELRQRDAARRQRQLTIVAVASLAGLLFTSALAVFAFLSRGEAIRQRDLAERKTMTAERTVGFVKSLFEVSDPSEARGATITAREILDRGAREIRTGLADEPAVRAELGTTLGEVYSGLGLYRQGDRLVREMLSLQHPDTATRTRQLLALAESQTRAGDYGPAIGSYRTALRLSRDPGQPRPDLVPRILVGLGEALSAAGEHKAADTVIGEALQLDRARHGDAHPDTARDLEALGLNAFFAGELARARGFYARASEIRLRSQGALHPRVAEDLNTLGAIAYMQGDGDTAERSYRQALAAYTKVLGPAHPEVANTSNNLARVLIERRRYREARPLLEQAVRINLAERGPEHDDIVFPLNNLAIVEEQLGATARAEALYRQALLPARKHGHRAIGPILVDLAALRCREGAAADGLGLLDEAMAKIAADYPGDPWRAAWLENVRGACLIRAGARAEGLALLRGSMAPLRAKWPAQSHFGALAAARLGEAGG